MVSQGVTVTWLAMSERQPRVFDSPLRGSLRLIRLA